MKITSVTPFGSILQAKGRESILSIDPAVIRRIIEEQLLVIFRGYALLSDMDYIAFAKQFGDLLAWEFGEILDLKMQRKPANHIFGRGRVELHWDGAYVDQKPHFNLFQCLKGSAAGSGGETLFVHTPRVLEGASEEEINHWKSLTISYSTEKKAHYGGQISSPLVCRSPYDNTWVIRYIEAFNEDNIQQNPVDVRVDGMARSASNEFLRSFNRRLYMSSVMYQHAWCDGDFVMADNSRLLHGRSRFISADDQRHIKRINIL